MATYPGWSALTPESTHHDFLRNFLCDLLSPTTPDGRNNGVGAALMVAGIAVLTLGGLLPLWRDLEAHNRRRQVARLLGAASACLVGVICLEQALGGSRFHNGLTLLAGALGLVPTAFAAITDCLNPRRPWWMRPLVAWTFCFACVNFVSYSIVQLGGPLTPWVPVSQKLALIGLLLWVGTRPPGPTGRIPRS